MSDDENADMSILGFTKREVELVLMSVQCIKPNRRFKIGWEVEMKDFADLTNTSVRDARAQWKDLSSRLMELPRLPGESASSEQRGNSEEIIQDYIVVKDEADDVSAADEADVRKNKDERKARREARTKRKAKQAAKPSILDSLEADLDGEDSIEVTNNINAKGNRNGVIDSPNSEDPTIQAWADIGDDMTEEKWNEMGDKLAL